MSGEGSLFAWKWGTGPPRFENVRCLFEVNRRGFGAHGPAGGSQGQDAKFSFGGTCPSCGSGIDSCGDAGGDCRTTGGRGLGLATSE